MSVPSIRGAPQFACSSLRPLVGVVGIIECIAWLDLTAAVTRSIAVRLNRPLPP